MGNKKVKKTKFVNQIVKSYIIVGICTIIIFIIMICILALIGTNNLVSPDIYPRVQLAFLFIYIICIILCIFLVSCITARKIKNKGKVLLKTTKLIQEQQLEFGIEYTGMEEIDTVLDSLDQMRDALTTSLKSQWKLEHNKQKYIAALIHDLKTPITVVKSNFYLLKYENLSAEGEESLKDVNIAIDEIENYMSLLLEVSANSKREKIEFKKCNLSEIVENVVRQMNVIFKEKDIEIDRNIASGDVPIWAQKSEIARVIQNILSNAKDFAPKGSKIRIIEKQEDNTAIVIILDEGNGFSDLALANGKEIFFMADQSRTQKNHYGLGLSIADKIMKEHEGSISIDNSTTIGGAMVTLRLPLHTQK